MCYLGCMTVTLQSTLCCPACGHAEVLVMPIDACAFFHACARCYAVLRPKAGHCCVFCSYGSVPCPSMQQGDDCCAPAAPPTALTR